jgi:catechol 2,3-dioxygenase-like lactoylglutathione lyase family enzyme
MAAPLQTDARSRYTRLLAGTMVATSLDASRQFYEQFLGLDCVRYAPDRLLMRDAYARARMAEGSDDFFLLDVQEVEEITHPQRMLHHWGLDVASAEEVDLIHAQAKANKARFGFSKLFPISRAHGSHQFYCADRDMNWWEIEYRLDGLDNEGYFARGDVTGEWQRRHAALSDPAPIVDPAIPPLRTDAVVSQARFTHGTCEQLSLEASRRFVEEILSLRCVRHVEPRAQFLAGRSSFGVFAIELANVKPQQRQNRWILGVDSAHEVEAIYHRAIRNAAAFGLRHIAAPEECNGFAACTLQDADGNWWQVDARPTSDYRAMFDRGDVI